MCVIISKNDIETLENINKAIEIVIQTGESLWIGRSLDDIIIPLRDMDFDRMDRTGFEGCYFINVASNYISEIVDENCQAITDPGEVYSGAMRGQLLDSSPIVREDVWGSGLFFEYKILFHYTFRIVE